MFEFLGTIFNLSISNLSASDLEIAKSNYLANFAVSTPVAFFESAFVAVFNRSDSTFTFRAKDFGFGKYSLIYIKSFLSMQLLRNNFCSLSL